MNKRRFFRFAGIGTLIAALAGGVAWQAHAHGGGGRWHGPMSAGQLDERLDRMLARAYEKIEATPEQKAKIEPIVKGAAKDLLPLRQKAREAREQARKLLTAETIDRAAIERLRAEQLAAAEAASKRFTQALTDVAEVLTPAQRKQLAERFERRRGHRHGPREEGGRG